LTGKKNGNGQGKGARRKKKGRRIEAKKFFLKHLCLTKKGPIKFMQGGDR